MSGLAPATQAEQRRNVFEEQSLRRAVWLGSHRGAEGRSGYIAAEELGHIELVSHTINNMLLTGSTTRGSDPSDIPLEVGTDARNR